MKNSSVRQRPKPNSPSTVLIGLLFLFPFTAGCITADRRGSVLEHGHTFQPRGQQPDSNRAQPRDVEFPTRSLRDEKTDAVTIRARELYREGRLNSAWKALNSIRRRETYSPHTFELQAELALDSGDRKKYINTLKSALAANPNSARMHNSIGKLFIQVDQFGLGTRALQRAIELAPRKSEYARDLSAVLVGRGDVNAAIELMTRSLKQNPLDQSMGAAVAQLYELTGDFQSAAFYYNIAVKHRPNDARLRLHRARSLYHVGEFQKAFVDYQLSWKFLELDGSDTELIEFGDTCLRVNDFERAQQVFDQLARRSTHHSKDIEVLRGLCALNRGRTRHARGIITTALTFWPADDGLMNVLQLCNALDENSRELRKGSANLAR